MKKLFQHLKRIKNELKRDSIFESIHGYKLDLINPTTFNQKLYYRKYFGSHQYLSRFVDKILVRKYVEEKIGSQYLNPIIATYSNPRDINWENLPNKFVIKTNFGSGEKHISIITDKECINKDEVIKKFSLALKDDFGYVNHQPFYTFIKKKILIEEYIESENLAPNDYKFHVFKNKIFIQVDTGRYVKHQRSFFNEEWQEQDFQLKPKLNRIESAKKPENLENMLTLARKLAEDFDYVRVDLYNINGRILFGELTLTHGNGKERFNPSTVDIEWGKYWQLDKSNNSLYRK